MGNYNKVILIGNLTRDPELRYTAKGMAIAKLSLAVNRSWKDAATSEMKEEVTFIDIDAFGKQAEVLGQYMKKGRPIFVEGRLRLDSWEDKQTNQKRSKLGVVLEAFQFIDSLPNREGGGGNYSSRSGAPASPEPPPETPSKGGETPPEEDDVPF